MELLDQATVEDFRSDVFQGLSFSEKRLPSKYFYDQRGGQLFEQICETPEYYLTRTELAIMRDSVDEIVTHLGSRCMLVEYGSGSAVKTRLLLDHLHEPAAYVPVDVSHEQLTDVSRTLSADYPHLEVMPICDDFTQPLELPKPSNPVHRRVVYFPGSTLGNFDEHQTVVLLKQIAETCGSGGGLLIGVDTTKDARTLEAAYNDAEGVTREFNLNLLARMNRELEADFDLEAFEFKAIYNEKMKRIESYLISQDDQTVNVADRQFTLEQGEQIRTECSHKYDLPGFRKLAHETGFTLRHTWSDDRLWFHVHYLSVQ